MMEAAGRLKAGDYIKVPGDPYNWHEVYGVDEDYTSSSGRKVYLRIEDTKAFWLINRIVLRRSNDAQDLFIVLYY